MLQVHPWLRDEYDGSVYFPDQDSQYNLHDTTNSLHDSGGWRTHVKTRGWTFACSMLQHTIILTSTTTITICYPHGGPPPLLFLTMVAMTDKNHEGNNVGSQEGRKARFPVYQPDVHRIDQCNSQRWTGLWGHALSVRIWVHGHFSERPGDRWFKVSRDVTQWHGCFHELVTTLDISFWKSPYQKWYAVTFSNTGMQWWS